MAQRQLSLADILTEDLVRSMADSRSWSRAQSYVENGQIDNLSEFDGHLTADAYGQWQYRVELWVDEEGGLGYNCSCPAGEGIGFCKHCIATALLWIRRLKKEEGSSKRSAKGKKRPDAEVARDYLLSLSREKLTEIIIDSMHRDSTLRTGIMMRAQISNDGDLSPLYKALKEATRHGGYIDYYGSYGYAQEIRQVIGMMREYLSEETASGLIGLCEEGLEWVSKTLLHADDSNGDIGGTLGELQDLHLDACRLAKPDGVELAERLYGIEMQSEWDVFYNAGLTYRDVFGNEGVKRYHELVMEAWEALPPLQHDSDRWKGKRWHLEDLVKQIAAEESDEELLLSLLQRDRNTFLGRVELALFYKERDNPAEAIRLLEEGLEELGDHWQLTEVLLQLYVETNARSKALDLLWTQFTTHPDLRTYKALIKQAAAWRAKTKWRDKALQYVQDLLSEKEQPHGDERTRPYDGTLLVELLLLEKRSEKAWEAAIAYGCGEVQWLQLATVRAPSHPDDAVIVWQEQLETYVQRTATSAYQQAVELLSKMEELLLPLGREEEFNEYLEYLQSEYKLKRNFMKLLRKQWGEKLK